MCRVGHSLCIPLPSLPPSLPPSFPPSLQEFIPTPLLEVLNHAELGYREIIATATEVASAMAYLHSQGVLHCDLGARNISKLLFFSPSLLVLLPPSLLSQAVVYPVAL